ncbi:uncharacterized protein EV420DRAFT_1636726 [Desarmillaria tabescens]|uniref:Uncharacterized protein n=1 Tax=Armillaria tabescens TaxID=1929756 RepID=A0AA39T5L7_ARMTA|nr:uncharacterized protein EV420DRAFT_1636726 [Desarmillaria tabescens]KAK0466121.1 hypothetical protein EV420DRAFT_1636726 [Desarmillaria tabescens]
MLPHFGEYVAFKLDPVASLKALDDPEVAKACEALESKTYVSCVTYLLSFPFPGVKYVSVSMTLLSKGLPNADPDRFITSDMSVPVLPNTSSSDSQSRPPLELSTSLPWPDCYHPTQARVKCRLPQSATDVDVALNQSDEGKASSATLPLSEHDAESEDCRPLSECSRSASDAGSEHSRPANEAESQYAQYAGGAETGYSHSISEASEGHAPAATPASSSFFRSLFEKLLPCLPCLRVDFHDDDDEVASISPSDPVWSHPIFGACPPDTLPVMVVLGDLESLKAEQINDPWDFFGEIDALKKIEEGFKERMKAKT